MADPEGHREKRSEHEVRMSRVFDEVMGLGPFCSPSRSSGGEDTPDKEGEDDSKQGQHSSRAFDEVMGLGPFADTSRGSATSSRSSGVEDTPNKEAEDGSRPGVTERMHKAFDEVMGLGPLADTSRGSATSSRSSGAEKTPTKEDEDSSRQEESAHRHKEERVSRLFDEVMGLGPFSATSSRSSGVEDKPNKEGEDGSRPGECTQRVEEDSNTSGREERMNEDEGETERLASPSSDQHSPTAMETEGEGEGSGKPGCDEAAGKPPALRVVEEEEDEEDEDWHFALPMDPEDAEKGRETPAENDPFATVPAEEDQEKGDGTDSANTSHSSQDGGVPILPKPSAGTEDSQQRPEPAPAEERNPPASPVNVKDEPIDEGYDAALLPQGSIKQIKEELDNQEEESLKISSVYSVGGANSFVAPTMPAPVPVTQATTFFIPGRGTFIQAAGLPPIPIRPPIVAPNLIRSLAPIPRQPQPPPPPTASSVSCSGCSKVLLKGQTAFQRKGSTQLFCSTVCLTGHLPTTSKARSCYQCLKEITQAKDLVMAPIDASNYMHFCSHFCLFVFNRKRKPTAEKPAEKPVEKPEKPACSVCRVTTKTSSGVCDKKSYRIVEQLPSDSKEDYASGSDDESLPEKGLANTTDDEWLAERGVANASSDDEWLAKGLANVSRSNSGAEDTETAEDAEDAMDAEGAEDAPPAEAEGLETSSNVWKNKDNKFEGHLPPFLGEWKVNVKGAEPLDFFMHLFPEYLIDEIVHSTNLYALQKGIENLAVTRDEMKIFLGMNMVMSYLRYPRSRTYWSAEEGLRLDLVANAMSVNRFENILRYLHFIDNCKQEPENLDKLFKIRPVLDALQNTFLSAVDPEEFQSIGEQIIPFTGRLSLKQHVKNKSNSWGVKVWVRTGTSGYMYMFEVYQGLTGHGQVSPLGIAGDVIMYLCDDLQQKNHKVFFDEVLCTIPLIETLQKQGIYGTGACRINRLQGAQVKLKSQRQLKKEGRGACSVVSNPQNITVTRWLDSSLIHVASSCVGQSPTDVAQRFSKKVKKMINIQRPFSVNLYNTHIEGVELMDQCLTMYPHRRKTNRWYIQVFFHFLDVAIVNAWHLYKMSGLEDKDLLHFKASVARALINLGSVQTRSGRLSGAPPPVKRRARAPPEIRLSPGNHWPKLTTGKHANRCHDAACKRKTKYSCMQCLVPLCPGCFANFHSRDLVTSH